MRGPPLCILFVGTLRVTFSCDCLESECAWQPPRTGELSLNDQNGDVQSARLSFVRITCTAPTTSSGMSARTLSWTVGLSELHVV